MVASLNSRLESNKEEEEEQSAQSDATNRFTDTLKRRHTFERNLAHKKQTLPRTLQWRCTRATRWTSSRWQALIPPVEAHRRVRGPATTAGTRAYGGSLKNLKDLKWRTGRKAGSVAGSHVLGLGRATHSSTRLAPLDASCGWRHWLRAARAVRLCGAARLRARRRGRIGGADARGTVCRGVHIGVYLVI